MIELLTGMHTDGGEGHIGWFEDRQQKMKEFIEELYPVNLIEIGFNMGHSCKLICDTIVDLKKNVRSYKKQRINFYVFDICSYGGVEDNFKILQEYYKDKNIKLNFIKGSSVDTVKSFIKDFEGVFDFVEVDGLHTPDYVHKDIINTYKKIRKGGIIYVDDYKSTHTPCYIEEGVDSVDWSEYDIDSIDGLFWGIKK
jgi:hypothetical protein